MSSDTTTGPSARDQRVAERQEARRAARRAERQQARVAGVAGETIATEAEPSPASVAPERTGGKMTQAEVEEAVFGVIAAFFRREPGSIGRDTTAADVPGWDSLSNMPMVLEVEDRLGIELPLRALGSLANVGELADLCRQTVNR
jgi:acyl carrier protein